MKLQAKIWLGAGAVIAVIMTADVYIGYRAVEAEVRAQLDQDARIVRAVLMATRRVYHQQFLASKLPVTEATVGFLPAHALPHIAADFPKWINTGLRFNNVSDRPRNPANQADEHELAAMEWFRANPKAADRVAEIKTDGGNVYHFTAPIWIEPYCLGCHGDSKSAPPSIQSSYTNAYGYQFGDLRGVMSIKLPMDELRAHAREIWLQRFGMRVVGYMALVVLISLLMRQLVVIRLAHLRSLAQKLEAGDLSARAMISGNDEVTELASSFNAMSDALALREAALKESLDQRQAILQSAMDGFWLADALDGRLLEVNETYCRMSGYSAAELLSMRIPDLEDKEAAEDTGAHMKRVVADGEDRFESRHRRKDGSLIDLEISVQFRPVDGGRFVAFLQDITERKRSERLLTLEHAIARSLASGNDESSTLIAVMRTICEEMGWERSTYWRSDEAAGVMRFGEFWDSPGLNLEGYTEHSRNVVFAPGVGLVGRVWLSGEPIWVADFVSDPRVVQHALGREIGVRGVFVFPVKSEGRTIGALAFFSRAVREPDERLLALTRVIGSELGQFLQRKHAEDQVFRLNAELEQRVADRTRALEVANRELESFSYSVSHDLRAPLRAIEGFSSLLESEYAAQLDERAKDYFRRVRGGATRMGLLIDDLLNLSRLSRQEMKIGPVDLSALAREAAEDLRGAEPERKVIWVIAPLVKAEGDLGLLRVAMQNLIGNAWKYSSKRESARIEFGCSERDGRPAYFIRDNGEGFDMAYADKLFGAFQRLHSPGEFPGSGIGLATVKRIIHRHGGEVGAESKVGEGATFWFTL